MYQHQINMPPVEYSKYSKIELSVLAISDIIQELLKAHENGKDLNLNKTKTQISAKYGLPSTPKVCQQVLNIFFIINAVVSQQSYGLIRDACLCDYSLTEKWNLYFQCNSQN